ncbi:hypothetical protein [Synechococcus sp. MIT S1220]|uniref:hypothetical protein n=1 Tax=Synechococcus sp. MIT S1220 TaxID=3082549 RepID=UPI0039AFC63F
MLKIRGLTTDGTRTPGNKTNGIALLFDKLQALFKGWGGWGPLTGQSCSAAKTMPCLGPP